MLGTLERIGNNIESDLILEYKYKSYSLNNFRSIPQVEEYLSEEQKFSVEVVGNVLPFKTNNYVINELINWEDIPNDPIYILNFPQKEMLIPEHYDLMAETLKNETDKKKISEVANKIRLQLNPHPAGQLENNVPKIGDQKLSGIQHKYKQTVLFFPTQGQTCHAYCSFCFRWPQFTGMNEYKFAMKEASLLTEYVSLNRDVTDILFTGGDPMIMSAKIFASYIDTILKEDLTNLKTIRIGTKSLGYWPYKFINDRDSEEMLDIFRKIADSGKHLSIMAHFNHPNELDTPAVKEAIKRIRATGAEIRTQSPILDNINANPEVWAEMWQKQVSLGCIPYYMFAVRDTGAQHYFGVSLVKAWEIFRDAYQEVSGLARTVRGPSMSSNPGKIHVLGVSEINGEKVMALQFLQGRNSDWVLKPFYAKYDPEAIWIDDLKPAFGEKEFFYTKELEEICQ